MAFQSLSQKDLLHKIVFHANAHASDAWIGCTEQTPVIRVPPLRSLQPRVQLGARVTPSG